MHESSNFSGKKVLEPLYPSTQFFVYLFTSSYTTFSIS
jgi:hypothetical protein